ncbi:MerC domain-containing protein [Xanthocytophaga flava]|uniref:MerC domain-containing protein n=1 Tax=Xanthocytophaga flava TaxID=3048013 RepID=UPI0028D41D32|nr:MerC domain-containing protein [Xanthocytophaga flavus]
MKNFYVSRKSDWMGIISSVGCIIHCMFMPVLLSSAASFTAHEEYRWLDFLFLAIAAVAVWLSARKAHSLLVRIILIVAWAVFAGSIIWEESIPFASILMYLGSVLLIVGHVLNLRHVHHHAGHKH